MIFIMTMGSMVALAQTSQGTLSLGGSVGITTNKDENDGEDVTRSTFEFSPSVGYFVIDHLMVGLDLSISSTKEDDGFGGDDKQTTFGIGPFARYYVPLGEGKFMFTGEAGFGFAAVKDKPDGQDETKGSAVNFYVAPGFTFFPTEKWGFDLQVNLLNFSSFDPDKDNDDDKFNSFHFGITGFTSTIGIRYYIAR